MRSSYKRLAVITDLYPREIIGTRATGREIAD
jgi:hypothetical protein